MFDPTKARFSVDSYDEEAYTFSLTIDDGLPHDVIKATIPACEFLGRVFPLPC